MGEHVLFTTAAVSSWCEACVHPTTFHVNPMTYVSRSESNAAVMRPVDWIALVFSSYMVGLTVAGEVKDIRVCEIARERAGDAIAPQWRRALILTNGARRWIFLCAFGWIIPNLVALKGGDALNSQFPLLVAHCHCFVSRHSRSLMINASSMILLADVLPQYALILSL